MLQKQTWAGSISAWISFCISTQAPNWKSNYFHISHHLYGNRYVTFNKKQIIFSGSSQQRQKESSYLQVLRGQECCNNYRQQVSPRQSTGGLKNTQVDYQNDLRTGKLVDELALTKQHKGVEMENDFLSLNLSRA